MRHNAEQLEFDLVSPHLGAPAWQFTPREIHMLWGRIQHLDSLNPAGIQPSTELGELRVLIGAKAFQGSRRTWERRLQRDPIRFRKMLLALRTELEILARTANQKLTT